MTIDLPFLVAACYGGEGKYITQPSCHHYYFTRIMVSSVVFKK